MSVPLEMLVVIRLGYQTQITVTNFFHLPIQSAGDRCVSPGPHVGLCRIRRQCLQNVIWTVSNVRNGPFPGTLFLKRVNRRLRKSRQR